MEENPLKENQLIENLSGILLREQNEKKLQERNEKLKRLLLLLAKGTTLVMLLAAPKSGNLFRDINWDKSDHEEWKLFNEHYLKRTLRKLEKQKIVEIDKEGNNGIVKITDRGRKRILKFGLESLTISKPSRWDGKWRMVFYDVTGGRKAQRTRDTFRQYLKSVGFYPLQESVYLHAYPCEKEIEFLKYYIGIGNEVRIILAERIENDAEFRKFFGV